jgi:hypothetical protein
MAGLMMTIKGIPSTYNKDLQESVEPLIDHITTLKDSILIASRVLLTLTTFPDKMLAALTPDMLATDLAEYLVRKGQSPNPPTPPFYPTSNPLQTQASHFEKPTTSPAESSHSQKTKANQWTS